MAANIGLFRDIVREITLLAEQAPDKSAMLNQAESLWRRSWPRTIGCPMRSQLQIRIITDSICSIAT